MGYENAHTTGIWQEIERTQNFLSLLPAKPKAGTMTNDKTAAGSPRANAPIDAPARIEILLVGMGEALRPMSRDLRTALKDAGISSDPMSTGAAVRTYNVLLAEDRAVAAALIAVA